MHFFFASVLSDATTKQLLLFATQALQFGLLALRVIYGNVADTLFPGVYFCHFVRLLPASPLYSTCSPCFFAVAQQGGDSLSAFEMAKKKERDSEQERMRAAKAALWTRLDRMAADIPYMTPPRRVLIPSGCESYNPTIVVSPYRDEVLRQRKVEPAAEVIPDPRRFRSPPNPPLYSWTGPDDDADVPVIPLDDVTATPTDQAAQPLPDKSVPSSAEAAGAHAPLADPGAAQSGTASAAPAGAPGGTPAPRPPTQEPHRVGADGGALPTSAIADGPSAATGAAHLEAARNAADPAFDGVNPSALSSGQASDGIGVAGNGGGGVAGGSVGGDSAAGVIAPDGANRVSNLLGGLDLGKLQQLLGATNNMVGPQQRKPEAPYVPGPQPPLSQQQQLLPSRHPPQQHEQAPDDDLGYVPSSQGGPPALPPHNPLAPPAGGGGPPPGPGEGAAKNPAAQLSALLQLLTSQAAGSAGVGGPQLPQHQQQMHQPLQQQPPPPAMRHNGGPPDPWGSGGGGHMAHQMGNVHGPPLPPPGMPNMPPPGMILPGMAPPPHGMGGPGMGAPGMGGGMPPPHTMGPDGPHGMRPVPGMPPPPPGMGYPTGGGQQPLPVVHFRHGQVGGVHGAGPRRDGPGDMGRGAPGMPPPGFDGGRGGGPRGSGQPPPRGGGGAGLRRVNKPKNRVKCLFFNTPKGCRSGDSCEYIHEPPGGGGDIRLRYASPR